MGCAVLLTLLAAPCLVTLSVEGVLIEEGRGLGVIERRFVDPLPRGLPRGRPLGRVEEIVVEERLLVLPRPRPVVTEYRGMDVIMKKAEEGGRGAQEAPEG